MTQIAMHPTHGAPVVDDDVLIDAGTAVLSAHLVVPAQAIGAVVFAHAGGSTRRSARNRSISAVLTDYNLATVQVDLSAGTENADWTNLTDIGKLGNRVMHVREWLLAHPASVGLPIGYFGVSLGAPAALWAAAEDGPDVRAVVSYGARPDLAGSRLAGVTAPTLLLVGSTGGRAEEYNQRARTAMRCPRRMRHAPAPAVPDGEAATAEWQAQQAAHWFVDHLPRDPSGEVEIQPWLG